MREATRSSRGWIALLLLVLPAAGAANVLDADEAEQIVRAPWFEGVPSDRIAPLAEAAVARLAGLLDDPDEVEVHAPALSLLGRAGGAGAFEAVAAYAARTPRGDVDAAILRAHLEVPLALGQLAREDERALTWLLATAVDAGPAPWRARRIDGDRIGRLRQRYAITGLALSGRPAARDALVALASQQEAAARDASSDRGLGAHIAEALQLHDEHAAPGSAR